MIERATITAFYGLFVILSILLGVAIRFVQHG
jgi:hypothetical protein